MSFQDREYGIVPGDYESARDNYLETLAAKAAAGVLYLAVNNPDSSDSLGGLAVDEELEYEDAVYVKPRPFRSSQNVWNGW